VDIVVISQTTVDAVEELQASPKSIFVRVWDIRLSGKKEVEKNPRTPMSSKLIRVRRSDQLSPFTFLDAVRLLARPPRPHYRDDPTISP